MKSSEWMRETSTELSYRKGKDFWQQFRHVFQMKQCAIGPLQSSDRRLATSKEEISEKLRKTFFLGQHLKRRSFDEDHYVEVRPRVWNHDPQINELQSIMKNAYTRTSRCRNYNVPSKMCHSPMCSIMMGSKDPCWNILYWNETLATKVFQ